MKKKLPLKDLFIIRTWRISISFFSSLDKRHCINKKKKKKIVNQPLHSNSDKDIFVLNIRFSAIMSVLQISCSLIVSRKETKKKKKKNKFETNVQQTLCISLHFFPLPSCLIRRWTYRFFFFLLFWESSYFSSYQYTIFEDDTILFQFFLSLTN